MVTIQERNILDVTDGLICHQVNCQGVMGTGMALAMRTKYPQIFPLYQDRCQTHGNNVLGTIQGIGIKDTQVIVVNIFAQTHYGKDERYTSYDALTTALEVLAKQAKRLNKTVYIPFKMGCGNGGGNWRIVFEIIRATLNECNVIICKHGE